MKTTLLMSTSPEVSLVVGVPYGNPIYFMIGTPKNVGDSIQPSVTIKNTGDAGQNFRLKYERAEYGPATLLGYSEYFWLDPGAQIWMFGYTADPENTNAITIDTMRNNDQIYGVTVCQINGVEDGWMDYHVELEVQVATTITLGLSAANVAVGGTFKMTGSLTRNDTGSGLAGYTVILNAYVYNPAVSNWLWTYIGQVTTDSGGNYDSGNLTAPDTAGTYSYRSFFGEYGPFSLSMSQTSRLTTSTSSVAVPLVLATLLGLSAYGLSSKKTRNRNALVAATSGGIIGVAYVLRTPA